jgi:hypothetical protein
MPRNLPSPSKRFVEINPGVQILSVPTDIGKEASVEQFSAKVETAFGGADDLINNAGSLVGGGPISVVSPASWWSDFVSLPCRPFGCKHVHLLKVTLSLSIFRRLTSREPSLSPEASST